MQTTTTEAAATIYQQIAARSLRKLESYQSDLAHDQEWLRANPSTQFVHITTKSSTHIYAIPNGFGGNVEVPYLFGRSTPRAIAAGELTVIQRFDREGGALFQVCDNPAFHCATVRLVDGGTAAAMFHEGYESSCRKLQARGPW
jgi:hypothetical protein